MAGLGLLIVGFCFKLSAPPFHQWTPDTYEGAPAPVTAFLSVGAKAAAFLVLLRFLVMALPELAVEKLEAVFAVLAVLAMVLGNLMALLQTNVKRMLGYAAISHAGTLLIALAAGTREAYAASLFYLFVTILMNLGAFTVIVTLARGGRERERIDDYSGLARTRPGLAAAMALFLLSIVGLPGTAGFSAKFQLFAAAVNADQVELVVVGVLTSVISLVYCLRLPMVMYMQEPGEERPGELGSNEFLVLILCAIGVVYFGIFFDLSIFEAAIQGLRF
jgi:NADH-quinone oxidoreductase subunit N